MVLFRHPLAAATLLVATLLSNTTSVAWEISTPHPAASTHPTAVGRSIVELHLQGQRVWTGYGDYGTLWTKVPPVKLYYYMPYRKRWIWSPTAGGAGNRDPYRGPRTRDGYDATLRAFGSDAVYRIREIEGRLWAPAVDPRSDFTDFAVYDKYWSQSRRLRDTSGGPVPAHLFDVTSYNGALYAIGSAFPASSKPSSCSIWRSTNDGGNWHLFHQIRPETGYTYSRCYFGQDYKNMLWVQPYSFRFSGKIAYTRVASNSYRFDGSNWTRGASIFPDGGSASDSWSSSRVSQGGSSTVFENPAINPNTGEPVPATDRQVMLLTSRSPGSLIDTGHLIAFNGESRGRQAIGDGEYSGRIWDFAVHEGYVYALLSTGAIIRTNFISGNASEPVVWTSRFATMRPARSIAVSRYFGKTRITLGRKDSRIAWRDFDCRTTEHPRVCARVD